MRRIGIAVLGLAFVLAMGVAVDAATVYVDSSNTAGPWDGTQAHPFNKIQDGINAASDGDTVLVADGTYTGAGNKALDFGGKAIVVTSQHGAGATIIDCGGSGRGVYFHNGEGSSSVVEGFTIRNGSVTGGWPDGCGGAILCYDHSSPTIRSNIIDSNSASSYGGGIACWNYSAPTISNNIIRENSAGLGGGGISCYGTPSVPVPTTHPTIINNTITGNSTGQADGGGIECNYYASPAIINNLVAGNVASRGGGGICADFFCSPTITNNTISGNSASNGGGIRSYSASSPTMVNNILWDNTAPVGKDGYLGGDPNYSTLTIRYCDVEGGQASIYVNTGSTLHWEEGNIDADPLFGNPYSGLAYDLQPGSPCLNAGTSTGAPSTDILGRPRPNPPGSNPDMGAYEQNAEATLAVELSSFTATPGDGQVTLRWVTESEVGHVGFHVYRALAEEGTYQRITEKLIEGVGMSIGTREYAFTDPNLTNGVTYWYQLEDVGFDGTTEMHGPISVTPEGEGFTPVEAAEMQALPAEFALSQNVPNPFNPATTIAYDLPKASDVTLTIFTVTGQQVAALVSGPQKAGHYEVRWDGSGCGDGVYLYRLEAGDFVETRRMLLLK